MLNIKYYGWNAGLTDAYTAVTLVKRTGTAHNVNCQWQVWYAQLERGTASFSLWLILVIWTQTNCSCTTRLSIWIKCNAHICFYMWRIYIKCDRPNWLSKSLQRKQICFCYNIWSWQLMMKQFGSGGDIWSTNRKKMDCHGKHSWSPEAKNNCPVSTVTPPVASCLPPSWRRLRVLEDPRISVITDKHPLNVSKWT